MHLTTMRQTIDQLAKEISSLKQELEKSRNENMLLRERLCQTILPPASTIHNPPPSPPSSSASAIGAETPGSLTFTGTGSSQTGTEFDLQFEQCSPDSLNIWNTPNSRSILHPSPRVQEQGTEFLHSPPTTYIPENSVRLSHPGYQGQDAYFGVQCEFGPIDKWTPFRNQMQIPEHTGLFDQEQMTMMPYEWY